MPLSEIPLPSADASGDDPPEIRSPPPGPMSRAAVARLEQVECPAFADRRDARAHAAGADMLPIVLASGKGANLYDVDGNRYVDLVAGFGALLLGHSPPSVLRAIEGQSQRLIQALGDVYSADAKLALLERVASLHPGLRPRVLLTQSGSDAVTAAIKTAALFTGKPGLVAFEGAYHGLGYGPLPACGLRESYRAPFAEQLNAHVAFAPYPRAEADVDRSLSAVDAALKKGHAGAVLVEPVLGRGGCVVPPDAFLKGLGEIAGRHAALVIADEIWTGLGRTGSMVRTTTVGAHADILCFGKGLGGGLALSACVAPDAIMQAWARGGEVVHTSTHAGSPLACAAALATLDALRFRRLVIRAREIGPAILQSFRTTLEGAAGFVEARGEGLMIGLELASAPIALRAARGMLDRGYIVLTGGSRGETLTLTPPLNIGEERLHEAARALRDVLAAA
jgi:4-aminobutyrate aminotransferase / (S)-3-amino-2-methylpropionate transaminase / 5-aminovalerate transaminase